MPTLRTHAAELHYDDRGQGDAVVLLHGLGSSTLDWEPQLAALAPRYRAIAIDMRGSGRSRDLAHAAGPFSVAMFAADVAAVIDHLGVAPAHVVGLSMGGMVAFQLALDQPHAVRTLTIVNSGPSLVPRTAKQRAVLALRLVLARTIGPRGMAKLLAPKLFPRDAALRATFLARMASNDKRAYAATQRALVGFDVSAHLAEIEVPALIVAADQDYTPLAYKQAYARRMPDARVACIADARHALPHEEPEKLQPVLDAFLAEHSRKDGQDHVASR
ncbi:MAG: alpha/beta fold hydrolase [Acidobacteriota bacterium]